jgi:hypothetical protein
LPDYKESFADFGICEKKFSLAATVASEQKSTEICGKIKCWSEKAIAITKPIAARISPLAIL